VARIGAFAVVGIYIGKKVVRRDAPGNECGQASERGLFVREHTKLVATRFDQPLRFVQLGVGASAVRCVPGNAVHEGFVRHDPRVPLEPAHRAVGAGDAVLGPDDLLTFFAARSSLGVGLAEPRAGGRLTQLARIVAKRTNAARISPASAGVGSIQTCTQPIASLERGGNASALIAE
jgi:hypothetical protein